MPSNVKILIANREVGASGTPHYQGYVEFNTSVALSHLRNWNGRGHYEARKGSQWDAIKYCLKDYLADDGTAAWGFDVCLEALEGFGLVSFGLDKSQTPTQLLNSLNKQKVSKLTQLKHLIDEGASDKDLADFDFDTWCRSHRALQAYRLLCAAPRNWEMEILVLYGPTGTGKSKYCYDSYSDVYWKQRGKWWDNYAHQETVVLDEFYGWLQWDVLLRLCDRYPLLVETKGGQIQFSSKRIVFTSNTPPGQWYKNSYFEAFVRRVTKWIYMPSMDARMECLDYKDFLNCINNNVRIEQL